MAPRHSPIFPPRIRKSRLGQIVHSVPRLNQRIGRRHRRVRTRKCLDSRFCSIDLANAENPPQASIIIVPPPSTNALSARNLGEKLAVVEPVSTASG